jgi:hypothetical protein
VPDDAPSPLYYQCLFHEPMNGELRLIAAPPPSANVTALRPGALVALGALLLLLGALALLSRRFRQTTA